MYDNFFAVSNYGKLFAIFLSSTLEVIKKVGRLLCLVNFLLGQLLKFVKIVLKMSNLQVKFGINWNGIV